MKRLILLGVFLIVPAHCFINSMRTFDLIDQMFAEMHERVHAQKGEAPDYDLQIKKNGDALTVSVAVPQYVTSQDISVQTEDDVLYVMIKAHGDRVELIIKDQTVDISATQHIMREEKDEQGEVRATSSGSSHMAQTVQLPAKIDLQRKVPTADLINGILTITIAIKGAVKIPVNSDTSLKCPGSGCDCDRPPRPEDTEIGRDVFKDTFEK